MCNHNFKIGFISRWLKDDAECNAAGGDTHIKDNVKNGFHCGYECRVEKEEGDGSERDCKFIVLGHGDDNEGDCYHEKSELCWNKDNWVTSGNAEDYNIFGVERRRK